MKINFSVQTPGMQISQNRTIAKAKKVLWLSMHKMEELAKLRVPVDTGLLRRSINLQPRAEGSKEYILADGVEYGEYIEYGTSPHYPPIAPLKKWSKRVLGDESLAYAVAKKIAIKGTSAQPFFRPALLEVKTIWVKKYWARIMSQG